MTSLVTGATGFLGSHIVDRLLARGEPVRALVRTSSATSYLTDRAVDLVTGDITDRASLPAALEGIDVVYHAAAYVSDWGPWSAFRSVTVRGTRNMLKAAATARIRRFLHVSTDGVYAYNALNGRVTEKSALEKHFGLLDYYRRSKSAAERTARKYQRERRLAVTVVRPSLLLGERDAAMLPGTIAFLKSPTAAYLGNPRNRLPYVYAGDVAEACVFAATSPRAEGEIYNVVSDEYVTQKDFFKAVAEATGLRLPRRSIAFRAVYALAFALETAMVLRGRKSRPDLTRFGVSLLGLNYEEDSSKLQRELGWQPTVPMREAIRRSVEWSRTRRTQAVGS